MSSFVLVFIVVTVPLVISGKVGLEEICVPVNFEDGLENFDFSSGPCAPVRGVWKVDHYADSYIHPPHPSSRTFITQTNEDEVSCTTSFDFQATTTGIVEVTFYMKIKGTDFLHLTVNRRQADGNLAQTTQVNFGSGNINNDEFNTVRIVVESGAGTFNASVSNFVYHNYVQCPNFFLNIYLSLIFVLNSSQSLHLDKQYCTF